MNIEYSRDNLTKMIQRLHEALKRATESMPAGAEKNYIQTGHQVIPGWHVSLQPIADLLGEIYYERCQLDKVVDREKRN